MKVKLLNIILIASFGLLLLMGCNPDSNDIDRLATGNGKVVFSIRAVENGASSSRASEDVVPVSNNEKINDWWMVFVEVKNNRVAKILYRKDANPGLGSNKSTDPIEEEQFETDFPAGHYDVYAFANITPDLLKQSTGLSFSVGYAPGDVDSATWSHSADGNETTSTTDDSSSELSSSDSSNSDTSTSDTSTNTPLTPEESEAKRTNVNPAVNGGTNLNLWNNASDIPMCGFLKNIEVKNTVEETFSIEVVRMVAKIEFQFTNKTAKEITVNSVSIDPVTSSAVSLMPNYSCLGVKSYDPLVTPTPTYGILTYTPSSSITLPASTDAKKNCFFYCKESVSNHPTKKFTIGVNISRKNDDGVVFSEELHYSPTEVISYYINRNDWIKIPISFTDWIVDFQVIFYPPIGGYPAVANWNETNTGSHYFTFGSQGQFSIVPKIREAKDGSNWLQPNEYIHKNDKGEFVADENKLNLTISGDDIFYDQPAIDKKTGEIVGRLSEKTGTALVTVSFKLDNDLIVSRKLYIIRKKSI